MTDPKISRRGFIVAAAAVGYALAKPGESSAADAAGAAPATALAPIRLSTFDYQGVKLRDSRWQKQFQMARDFYFGVSDDDILHGYRASARLPAPGKALGGWCSPNSNTVFGQWLQGMSRLYRATGDDAMRDKAIRLFTEWSKTVGADGNCGMGHYPFEKLVGGLVDLKQYAGHDEAVPMMEKVIDYATKNLNRDRVPAAPRPPNDHSGRPGEWYTLAENHYRAFQLTGLAKYKDFGDVWQYNTYWGKFAQTADPRDAYGVHAYSHVNTWSSCAMAYAVTGDAKYLTMLTNAYDFLQNTQCFATGGFGPVERIMPTNGNLGVAIETQQNSCEAPCCSWAAFKIARYLMTFTGESRFGDWMERIMYNAIGAALPITDNGKNYYYADYRVAGGIKNYARSTYTCCSGTYIQAVTEYHNLIYFKDANNLCVNLYLPSEVTWASPNGQVKLVQETSYPEAETSTMTLSLPQRTHFVMKLRIPGWSSGASLKVNGASAVDTLITPGKWATIERDWNDGDKIEIRIPLPLRFLAVDKWHPDRVAVMRGPVVLVQDASVHEPVYAIPADDDQLNKVLTPSRTPGQFTMLLAGTNLPPANPGKFDPPGMTINNVPGQAGAVFMPFYSVQEVNSYRMYFDRKDKPVVLW